MSGEQTKFDLWWNSYEVKRKVSAAYSLGASVVIMGAMFKILHLSGAGYMLGIGMSVESIIFFLGIFDKPHNEYEWDKVFNFHGEPTTAGIGGVSQGIGNAGSGSSRAVGLNYTETINDDDVKKLSESIKNLTQTAQQFASLSTVVSATEHFVKNIDSASQITNQFIKSQESLNGATGSLVSSYQGITDGMDAVEKNTKLYAGKVDNINKNLSSINSIYEIQLKNIQVQSEGLTQQTDCLRTVSAELNAITADMQRMKTATATAATETENFKASTTKLAKQVDDLNQVYGNMLNALN